MPKAKIPDSIDSALAAGLRDPRERLGLLKLEQSLVEFVKSDDAYWEIGGTLNSQIRTPNSTSSTGNSATSTRPQTTFQRCLLHRLADRFQIAREPQEDGFIRIVKTPETALPSRLLLNVNASEYQGQAKATTTSPSNDNSNSGSLEDGIQRMTIANGNASTNGVTSNGPVLLANPTSTSGTSSSKPRKMKIMKRSSSNVSTASSTSSSSKNANKPKGCLSDRERKYAEARARIFQQSQEEAMAETLPLNHTEMAGANPLPATTAAAAAAAAAAAVGTTTGTTLDASASNGYSTQPAMVNSDVGATTQDNTTTSKVTWRNRQSDWNDPDFQRGRPPAPSHAIGYGYSVAPGSGSLVTGTPAYGQAAGAWGAAPGAASAGTTPAPRSYPLAYPPETTTTSAATRPPQSYPYRKSHSVGEPYLNAQEFPSLR